MLKMRSEFEASFRAAEARTPQAYWEHSEKAQQQRPGGVGIESVGQTRQLSLSWLVGLAATWL